jgi:hypothetical protein
MGDRCLHSDLEELKRHFEKGHNGKPCPDPENRYYS